MSDLERAIDAAWRAICEYADGAGPDNGCTKECVCYAEAKAAVEAAAPILATPAPQGGSGWRPIESAPKDGSDILACWPLSEAVGIVHYAQEPSSHGFEWLTEDDAFVSTPTYWQPLPSPPSQAADQVEGVSREGMK